MLPAISLATPLERAATLVYWHPSTQLRPADAARIWSQMGPVAAGSYEHVRAKELKVNLRRQLARARATGCA